MALFGRKKPENGKGAGSGQNPGRVLHRLSRVLDRLDLATAFSTPEPDDGETDEPGTGAGASTEPITEDNDDFDGALEELKKLRPRVTDSQLSDILDHYTDAIVRKHHAWRWQQDYREASIQDKDRIWSDLEAADQEAKIQRECFNERIEQLLSAGGR